MKTTHLLGTALLSVSALLPLAASAESLWHETRGEIGWVYVPEHANSVTTRAQVVADTRFLLANPANRAAIQRGLPLSQPVTPSTLTRDQVRADARAAKSDPEYQRIQRLLYSGG